MNFKDDELDSIPSLKNLNDYYVENINGISTPVSKVETWSEFLSLQTQINKNNDWLYRGQENGNWPLKASLMRLCCDPKDNELTEMLELFRHSLNDMELKSFLRDEDIEQWCIARHYGLASPALDWSYDPRVSLFFAFENYHTSKFIGRYSAIYMINKSFLRQHYSDLIYIHDDPMLDGRINAQKGVLMFTQNNVLLDLILEAPSYSYKYFRKVYIPRNDLINCLKSLEQDPKPISKKDIFPNSIEGAIQYCNFKFQKYFRQNSPAQTILGIKFREPFTFKCLNKDDHHHFVLLDNQCLTTNCVKCDHKFDLKNRSLEDHINHYMSHGLKIIGLEENLNSNNKVHLLICMGIEKDQDIIR